LRFILFIAVASALPAHAQQPKPLIVIGFMGGNVKAANFVHREALMARDLQRRNPGALRISVFANHDGPVALKTIVPLLHEDRAGQLTEDDRRSARIIVYGHSWGASEAVTLAARLHRLHIPVLLTIQVDSVQKFGESDRVIPPNVVEAVNFYQAEGLLRGRPVIAAAHPTHTTILGNFLNTYKTKPVACDGYPWFARTFMKQHIEIENDPVVWARVESLIQAYISPDPTSAVLRPINP